MRDEPVSVRLDCYAKSERGLMDRSRELRERAVRPLLRALTRLRVHADHLTWTSLACGVAFAALWSMSYPVVALVALAAHGLLDGLDGPLARFQKRASSRGSFTDTMADQVVVAASTFALIATSHASPVDGAAYIFTYTVVVFFALARNALDIPYGWLVRPRMIVYAWIPVEAWLLPDSLDIVLRVFTALLAFKLVTGFWKIRRRLR